MWYYNYHLYSEHGDVCDVILKLISKSVYMHIPMPAFFLFSHGIRQYIVWSSLINCPQEYKFNKFIKRYFCKGWSEMSNWHFSYFFCHLIGKMVWFVFSVLLWFHFFQELVRLSVLHSSNYFTWLVVWGLK